MMIRDPFIIVVFVLITLCGWIAAIVINFKWSDYCDKLNKRWADRCDQISDDWYDLCGRQNEGWKRVCDMLISQKARGENVTYDEAVETICDSCWRYRQCHEDDNDFCEEFIRSTEDQ